MEKTWEELVLEIIKFDDVDVITASDDLPFDPAG